MVTIKMVAEKCGLSIAAVSRALNNRPGISQERAEQVRQVAREMGYQPNEAARMLKTNRSKNIGILYHNMLTHEFFAAVLEGIQTEAAQQGYEITFLQSNQDLTYYEHARRRQCDGVILAQGPFNRGSVQPILDSGMPLVSIEYDHPGHTAVRNDNVRAMEEVVRYVHSLGHERIALIHGEPCQVTDDRLTGFHRGCRDCGIDAPDEYVVPGHFRQMEENRPGVRRLLSLAKRPTCIIFPDDMCYLGGMAEIESMGLRIPEDVSCVGFGGVDLIRMMRPRLTTYSQNPREIGRRAAREVISAIEEPKFYAPHIAVVDGHIEPGDTVKDLR